MDQAVLERMVHDKKITSAEILAQTPIEGLDAALTVLMRHRSAKEVCKALMERIAKTPLDEFGALRGVYFRHHDRHAM
jgi:16S rRNA C1402 N4-methylase RsmH